MTAETGAAGMSNKEVANKLLAFCDSEGDGVATQDDEDVLREAARRLQGEATPRPAAADVPREPTEAMIDAVCKEPWIGHPEANDATIQRWGVARRKAARHQWRAMWDASQQRPERE